MLFPKSHSSQKKTRKQQKGFVALLLVAAVIGLGILLSGAVLSKKDFPPDTNIKAFAATCCDSGDGAACKPETGAGQTFTLAGPAGAAHYGLLRSDVTLAEGAVHLKDSGSTFNGDPIILNSSEGYRNPINSNIECGQPGQDQIYNDVPTGPLTDDHYCTAIPDDEIVYVCVKNCHAAICPNANAAAAAGVTGVYCYGDATSVYNVYFRLADADTPGVPEVIKNCNKASLTNNPQNGNPQPTIVFNPQPNRDNLQLHTFRLVAESTVPWLSPYCKPAVYLYPEQTSYVSVKLNPTEPLTYSDPIYPSNGWGVVANPTGEIFYQSKPYDYLYYETKIEDKKINIPTKGFVVERNKLSTLFKDILPKLGLNPHETQQFTDYWADKLPASPYYFVGIVPEDNLNAISPLNVNPLPQTTIRVTLYFKPLDEKENVEQPTITTPVRTGFTVVEWGGIYKRDKNHEFSCLQ